MFTEPVEVGLKHLPRSRGPAWYPSSRRWLAGSGCLAEERSTVTRYGCLQDCGTCEHKMLTLVALDEHRWRWRRYRRGRTQSDAPFDASRDEASTDAGPNLATPPAPEN